MSYDEKIAQYYDLLYSKKDYSAEVNYIKKAAGGLARKTILDIGCGTGAHAILMAKENAKSILGVDISSRMIERSKSKKADLSNVEFMVSDIVGVCDDNFDVITSMFNVINHIDNLEDLINFFKEARRRIKRPGHLIFDCWNGVATIRDLPRREVRTHYCDSGRKIVSTCVPDIDLMNSMIKLQTTIDIFHPETPAESFKFDLNHRIWSPRLLMEILNLARFEICAINKTYLHQPCTEEDYKIIFTCKAK
tara:strand:- start:5170 stop:5919 length:750 start_codon:yes stop_codon:yes gene_type:complete